MFSNSKKQPNHDTVFDLMSNLCSSGFIKKNYPEVHSAAKEARTYAETQCRTAGIEPVQRSTWLSQALLYGSQCVFAVPTSHLNALNQFQSVLSSLSSLPEEAKKSPQYASVVTALTQANEARNLYAEQEKERNDFLTKFPPT